MVNYKKYLVIIIIALTAIICFNQNTSVKKSRADLNKIRQDIQTLENELKIKTVKEKKTFSTVENYNRQTFLLEQLIMKLKDQEDEAEGQIVETSEKIDFLDKKIARLQQNYAKYVTAVYKYGSLNELNVLFNAESFNNALVRFKYLRMFSNRRQKDLEDLKDSKDTLLAYKTQLHDIRAEKEDLANEKIGEESNLKVKLDESKKVLDIVKNDKEEVKKQLLAKKKAEANIQNIISSLVAEESRKRAEFEKRKREEISKEKLVEKKANNYTKVAKNEKKPIKNSYSNKTEIADENNYNKEEKEFKSSSTYSYDNLSSFAALKGKLNWPVSGGKIHNRFGENKNDILNTVTLNYGIDLSISGDRNVKVVAEGVVSAIEWIIGYGSVVIVTHKGNFRTVYGHLTGISVKEGQIVKAGSVLGSVASGLEGNILHFEIWNERNYQNPEVWLTRK